MNQGRYAPVNGLNMYYEIHGSGDPLVLLHGGMTTIHSSFASVLPILAQIRQVIAVEQQGHGRTADIDRPLTFEQMADDTAALLGHLGVKKANFFGYSSGGVTALQVAIRHPDLVRRLVLVSAFFTRDGYYPEVMAGLEQATADKMPAEMKAAYTQVAPDPEGWATLVAKVAKQASEFRSWPPEDIRSIQSPTLVMVGDHDIVRPEHAVEMYRLLPHGQLAVLPGASHGLLFERPDWVVAMITAFLEPPVSKAP